MTQSDNDQIFELLTLCVGLSLKQRALSLKVSVGRASNFKSLSKNERKSLLEYLRQLETKKNLMSVMLVYAFELDLIDSIAWISYHTNIERKISDHLIAAGVTNEPLFDLGLPELERVLNHFRLMFHLTSIERLHKQGLQGSLIDNNKTKESFMTSITEQQLKSLRTLVRKHRFTAAEVQAIISKFSNKRTENSKDLFYTEANEMIEHLKKVDPCTRLRKKIFLLADEAKVIEGNTGEDKKERYDKLEKYLLENHSTKKPLSKMTAMELAKIIIQFEMIIEHNNEMSAFKATDNLLDELNISIQ